MATFVIGDIHGAHKALVQCLQRCNFDYEKDTLITLGDICDGWEDVYNCVEELLKIDNRIDIRGNHDEPFLEFIESGIHPWKWAQGGHATAKSYGKLLGDKFIIQKGSASMWDSDGGFIANLNSGDIPLAHKEFFRHQINYYIENNICFVHGGFDRDYSIKDQMEYTLFWDRELWKKAMCCTEGEKLITLDNFDKVFIGHTQCYDRKNPECLVLTKGGVTNLDTGAGWNGKLSIMNIETMQFWQSDFVKDLYPGELGRFA